MTESLGIARHMDRLAQHVSKRLKTMDVWVWMYRGEYPDDRNFPADVREALAKLKKLEHRYDSLWRMRSGVLRTHPAPNSRLHEVYLTNCGARERTWVSHMWTRGDWSVVEKDDKGDLKLLVRFEDGKFQWKRIGRESRHALTKL